MTGSAGKAARQQWWRRRVWLTFSESVMSSIPSHCLCQWGERACCCVEGCECFHC